MRKKTKKSWADYKREWRKKQREKRKLQPDQSREILRTPFFDFFNERDGNILGWCSDVLGERWWEFPDDGGLKPLTDDALTEEDLAKASDSLGRAETILGTLIDAASDLATIINEYKQKGITERLNEIDHKDPSNFDEITRLKRMRLTLAKQVRRSFPQWEVRGD